MCSEDRCRKLRRRYGITLEQYEEKLESQDNRCAICGVSQDKCGRAFPIDHCHDTGKNRDILCDRCNIGLGHYKDSPELLRKAAEYIERHRNTNL